jgi:cell division protein FtsA
MARARVAIGIDFGTEAIKTVALEVVRGEAVPRVVGVGAALSQGMRRGVVVDSDLAAIALKEAVGNLFKSMEAQSGSYYVGVGGQGLGYQRARGSIRVSRADNVVSHEDVKRAMQTAENNLLRIQNREILQSFPITFRIDDDTTSRDPVGLSGTKLDADGLFFTAFAHNSKAVVKSLDDARVDAEEFWASPYAAATALLSKRDKEVGVMVLDIGAATTSLIIFEDGLPYSLEVIPWGSAHITNDIVRGFTVDIDEAEKLKIHYGAVGEAAVFSKKDDLVYGNYSKKRLSEIIEARLDDIFEYVEKHLKKVDRTGLLPGGIILVGGGANLPGIDSFAKQYLKLPARIGAVGGVGGYTDKVGNPIWATAAGLALLGIERQRSGGITLRGGSGGMIARFLRAFLP